MRAIIIAAGRGARLMPLTETTPKCMTMFGSEPMLHRAVRLMRNEGIDDIIVIRGYRSDKVWCEGCTYVESRNWAHVNILGSLLSAREYISGEVLISYGDIVYTPELLRAAVDAAEPIAPVVDVAWRAAYEGRLNHPVDEAEKVSVSTGSVRQIGKSRVRTQDADGEFIGMLRLDAAGGERLVAAVDHALAAETVAGGGAALDLSTAYLTDVLQLLIDRGEEIRPILVRGGWREIDTSEDLQRAEAWLASNA